MSDLADKIEGLEAPCREMNEQICLAIGRPLTVSDDCFDYIDNVPPYTSSLDAAMTLVPEGWEWMMEGEETERHFPPSQWLYKAHLGDKITSEGSTPALALCAAALRARSEAIRARMSDEG